MPVPRDVSLVIIDMQTAFFEQGPLRELRTELVAKIQSLLEWSRENDLLTINVRTQHRADRSTWTLNMLEDDQGFAIEGDRKSQPLDELNLGHAVEIVKTRDDAFLGTGLEHLLRMHGINTLVMAGVSTQSCVAATATHAYASNLHVVLAGDAIHSDRPALHKDVLGVLEYEYRFTVVPTQEIIDGTGEVLVRGSTTTSTQDG